MSPFLEDHSEHSPGPTLVHIRIKVVPGAKRSQIVGLLGSRLKIRISAPPEGGKANKAVCKLLAQLFRVRLQDVQVIRGHTSPEKTLEIIGCTTHALREALAPFLP